MKRRSAAPLWGTRYAGCCATSNLTRISHWNHVLQILTMFCADGRLSFGANRLFIRKFLA